MKTTTHVVYVHVGHHMGDLRRPSPRLGPQRLLLRQGLLTAAPVTLPTHGR